ncbi:aminotransferase class V-fold PLP-dependent enzyme [Leucobacter sp. cx-42]|uniref:aminotransferase class V-fold PLP-dependent enzyme n=1 Tax=unclassified Leucobacter TaxID=2621730 RepID=UPI00165E7F0A|nr:MULTISPECIES: aminotransferase class V-fold PLP-dependent enzyme [unclassified Leucobacter]MBC9955382.1 aminotransferase class V-fold PLP-dependent enzyme [Leucobacter sp. cx-42]
MSTAFSDDFDAAPGYLSACTVGVPTHATTTAMRDFITDWARGDLDAFALGESLERSRALFARIAGVSPDEVAIGSQTSQLVSVIATAVPDDAEVLCAAGDFSSLTHPFEQLADRGVTVRYAPLAELAAAVRPETALVAFSLVQSATGEVADHAAISAAAAAHGARTCVDLTQSLGWLPIGAETFDYTVCHAYKWLCAPRGTAFMTVRSELMRDATPVAAGWCSADDPWTATYAGHTPLSETARRFDLSPVWPAVTGTERALEYFAGHDAGAIRAHVLTLANAARAELGLEPGDSAIVTWADPDGCDLARMQAAGITASGRAGNARIAFHVWNSDADVSMLAEALRD